MTKERPTHLCSLEIDLRDPSAIIQDLNDEVDLLRTERDVYRETLEKCAEAFEFLARYYFPDGREARELVKQALQS